MRLCLLNLSIQYAHFPTMHLCLICDQGQGEVMVVNTSSINHHHHPPPHTETPLYLCIQLGYHPLPPAREGHRGGALLVFWTPGSCLWIFLWLLPTFFHKPFSVHLCGVTHIHVNAYSFFPLKVNLSLTCALYLCLCFESKNLE